MIGLLILKWLLIIAGIFHAVIGIYIVVESCKSSVERRMGIVLGAYSIGVSLVYWGYLVPLINKAL